MCGIFSLFNITLNENIKKTIFNHFMLGKNRGPDDSEFEEYDKNILLGFHRLAINGLDKISNQPLELNNKVLICNGEIYNYKDLYEKHSIKPKTHSDCEVIIHLYEMYGIEKCIDLLDGVFAFVLIDNEKDEMFVSRDPYGVRPLYYYSGIYKNQSYFGFISEMKMVSSLKNVLGIREIFQFEPGSYHHYTYNNTTTTWNFATFYVYHMNYYQNKVKNTENNNVIENSDDSINDDNVNTKNYPYDLVRNTLIEAVRKRVLTTDRPIACLLSGGLDSSLITSIVKSLYKNNQYYKEHPYEQLETYSIGLKGSEDLKYARKVADFLKTNHTEIIVSEEEFLSAIPDVIRSIESYDTTTVRASVGNYLVSKYISEHSKAKVVFNGDGSDEVTGGYLYFHKSPNATAFDSECKRLLEDIHYFDVLRSDRCISSNGLEARTPFLDKTFVRSYLSIDKETRYNAHMSHCEKYILRKAFDKRGYLPDDVLWRTKEAFSDGVSSHTKSWFEIIRDHVSCYNLGCCNNLENTCYNSPQTDEQKYYRSLFNTYYHNEFATVIPYFWMPRFIENATDSSARTLQVYKEKNKMNDRD